MKSRFLNLPAAIILLGLWTGFASGLYAAPAAQENLNHHGITGAVAEDIVKHFKDIEDMGLPADFLRLRLREGIAKRADPRQIEAALDERKRFMKRSHELLNQASGEYTSRRRRRPHGTTEADVETLTRALESGLPAVVVGELYDPRTGIRSMRRLWIVEAGEMLHLAGVDPKSVRRFMLDSRDRNLTRMEILRAARYWIDKHRDGCDPESISGQLWSDGEYPRRDGGRDGPAQRQRGGRGRERRPARTVNGHPVR